MFGKLSFFLEFRVPSSKFRVILIPNLELGTFNPKLFEVVGNF